ncbi:MAG: hypothetical protein R3C13_07260 [Hyphomonas sp.]|uniref:hypothetical protein n=1 Tax=Hyphomonas sp. TaxID=87 RepID=UPI003527D0EE
MLKSHIMVALGLLLAIIYAGRLVAAFSLADGIGLGELYLIGGLAISGTLIISGLKERRRMKKS